MNARIYTLGVAPLKLTPGVEATPTSKTEQLQRIATLAATVEHYLPDFVKGVDRIMRKREGQQKPSQTKPEPVSEPTEKKDHQPPADIMLLHQDSFAAGYDLDEYTLLGMAIKYAGYYGVEVVMMGTNHETFYE